MEKHIREPARSTETMARPMTIPGIGFILSVVITPGTGGHRALLKRLAPRLVLGDNPEGPSYRGQDPLREVKAGCEPVHGTGLCGGGQLDMPQPEVLSRKTRHESCMYKRIKARKGLSKGDRRGRTAPGRGGLSCVDK